MRVRNKRGNRNVGQDQDTGRRLVCLFIYLKCPSSRPTTCHRQQSDLIYKHLHITGLSFLSFSFVNFPEYRVLNAGPVREFRPYFNLLTSKNI